VKTFSSQTAWRADQIGTTKVGLAGGAGWNVVELAWFHISFSGVKVAIILIFFWRIPLLFEKGSADPLPLFIHKGSNLAAGVFFW
jgi:hypothetical protein